MAERRSARWYGGEGRDAYIHRAWMRRGLPDSAFDGRPHIAIANTASDLTPCNVHLDEVAEAVKRGVWEAGGVPLNLPVAGGGYFRILPYEWTRWGIARLNRVEGQPAIFYLHPWEIDPDQPRLPAGLLGRFRHYRNLDRTEERLRQLLVDFRFGPVRQLIVPRGDARTRSQGAANALPYVW